VGHHSEAFIGIDTSKLQNAVAIAEGGRNGEVRYLGEIATTDAATRKLVAKLAAKYHELTFCYEAGPTGYGLQRLITSLGHECSVVAPSLIPRKAGDHVKTNRRDAQSLARNLRAGELTGVWVPDERHEAMRDLSRAREAAVDAATMVAPPCGFRPRDPSCAARRSTLSPISWPTNGRLRSPRARGQRGRRALRDRARVRGGGRSPDRVGTIPVPHW